MPASPTPNTTPPAPNTTYTLTLEVLDAPGVLVRTTQVFARRGCNITEVHVGRPTGAPWSHMTLVVHNVDHIDQIARQLEKLIDVHSVHVTNHPTEN